MGAADETGSPQGGLLRHLLDAVRARTTEDALCAYYDEHHAPGSTLLLLLRREPVGTLLATIAVLRLPRERAVLGDGAEGCVIRGVLRGRGVAHLPIGATGVAVLHVPADGATYSEGRGRQTLRRKVRAARRAGTTVRVVSDSEERIELLRLSGQQESNHPDTRYRKDSPDHTGLLGSSTWLAAYDAVGSPLALAVTPVDGEWAALCHFRTLGSGPTHSDSRYLLSQELVEHLSGRGVRFLLETYNPAHLTVGLRQFQRLLGYRLMRVRPSGAGR